MPTSSYVINLIKEKYPKLVDSDDEKILRSTLVKDLSMDSLDVIEFLLNIEQRFEINIPEEKLADVTKVEDLVALVDQCSTSEI